MINDSDSIIFFDGVCNLCSSFVQFVLKNEKTDSIKFASLQSAFTQEFFSQYNLKNNTDIQPETSGKYQSVYFYSNNQMHSHSNAALEIARFLKKPYSLFSYFRIIPKFIRDFIYKIIANNRYRLMGKKTECWMPHPKYKPRFLSK